MSELIVVQARDGKLTLEDMAGGSFTMCVQIAIVPIYPRLISLELQRRRFRLALRHADHQPAPVRRPR